MQVRVKMLESTHGLRSWSSRISYPYNSKQCLSLMMTFCTLCKLQIKMLSMSLKSASTASLPCFAVKYRRNRCICHLQPCKQTVRLLDQISSVQLNLCSPFKEILQIMNTKMRSSMCDSHNKCTGRFIYETIIFSIFFSDHKIHIKIN